MTTMTEAEVSAVADDVLRRTLGAHGFDHSEVHFDLDHDGVPSIFVDVVFRAGSEVTPGQATIDSIAGLSSALRSRGDERFPYFRPRFARKPATVG